MRYGNHNTAYKPLTFVVGLILYVFLFVPGLSAQIPDIPEVPKKPKVETSVYDEIGLLNASQKAALEQKLLNYADSTSTQIVIVAISSTNGQEIGYYATHWAHKWGIGQEDKDNGVLIVVAKDDRKMTIRTGYGIEHLLTDALSRRIIEKVMVPHFKNGDYYGGLDEATDVMIQIFAGEYDQTDEEKTSNLPIIIFIIALILFFILISRQSGKPKGGRRLLDDDFFGPIILSGNGRSSGHGGSWGGFGGGSSGGGFSGGFGGGGFGGGGASGGW